MNNDIDISVIIPVYNAEQYINRCIDSILNQTFQNFEVLLINDGSTDGSDRICKKLSEKDKRIKYFEKKNQGVSQTRQFGIEKAKGKYSIHIDPDDWIELNALELLYKNAIYNNSDIVICDFYINTKNTQKILKQCPSSLNHANVLKDLFWGLRGSCCNKLIRHSCYKRYNISFPPNINYCEDFIVCTKLLLNTISISYEANALYHYDQNSNANSITRVYNNKTIQQQLKFLEEIKTILIDTEFKELINIAYANIIYDQFMHNSIYYKEFNSLAKLSFKYIYT